ncbi:hypothetical protein J6590_000974 [Homalodisca vitripennis]|nr:hypothetical protein J6590_000974 [Homalodisca vitripennis]
MAVSYSTKDSDPGNHLCPSCPALSRLGQYCPSSRTGDDGPENRTSRTIYVTDIWTRSRSLLGLDKPKHFHTHDHVPHSLTDRRAAPLSGEPQSNGRRGRLELPFWRCSEENMVSLDCTGKCYALLRWNIPGSHDHY